MCYKFYLLILAVVGLVEFLPVSNGEKTEEDGIATSECHPPFESVNNSCYYFSEEQMNFNQALAHCEILGLGHAYEITLAMLDYDRDEDKALLDAVASKDKTFWVGGKKDDIIGVEWQWLDGRLVYRHAQFWEPHEPNQDENKCMIAQKNTCDLGNIIRAYIYDNDCSESLNFICQTGNIKCPTNFVKIGNYCYLQSWTIGLPALSWQYARDYCQTLEVHGGYHSDLAVFGLEQDDAHLMYNLMESHFAETWIGAYRDTDCYYQWIDGRELPLESVHWWYTEPSCGDDNSVRLYYANSYSRPYLSDLPGDRSYSFICQMFKEA